MLSHKLCRTTPQTYFPPGFATLKPLLQLKYTVWTRAQQIELHCTLNKLDAMRLPSIFSDIKIAYSVNKAARAPENSPSAVKARFAAWEQSATTGGYSVQLC